MINNSIRKTLTAALALFAALTLSAQTGGVKGSLISRSDLDPVSQARVVLYQGSREIGSVTTDEKGRFHFNALEDGLYDIVIQAPQHLETRINLTVNDGHVKDLFRISLSSVSAATAQDRFEDFEMEEGGFRDLPVVLFDQNDVFNSIAAYNFSSVRFSPRGYASGSQEVYLAGVRMNDVVSGASPFSLWSGLNEATRTQYSVTGLEVSDYGLGGYNGLVNIPVNAASVRKGLRGSVLTNSALYRLRLMLTYGSGPLDNGWSYAVSASARLGGNDWIRGVYYRSFAYYLSAEKAWGDAHKIGFTFFGTPGSRGAQNASTQEVYDLVGDNMYNSNWGYQNGVLRNARVRNTHEPIAIVRYDWKPSDRFKLGATLLYRFGKNGYTALDYYDALNPRPDYYRNLPSYFWDANPDYNRRNMLKYAAAKEAWTHDDLYPHIAHINWDRLYDVNMHNTEAHGLRSKYIVEERHVDQRDLNFAFNFKWRPSPTTVLTGGLEAKTNRTEHYKIVKDLLGGEYYLDIDSFAEREYVASEAKTQNDLDWYLMQGSPRILRAGDKFGYDYLACIRRAGGWFNADFALGSLSLHAGGRIGYTDFWREGLVRKGLFPGVRADGSDYIIDGVNLSRDRDGNLLPTSYGKSETSRFLTWAAKAGFNWVIAGKSRIWANAGYFTEAPDFNKVFLSARTRNSIVEDLKPTKTLSADVNWQWSSPGWNARLTAYYTRIMDQTDVTAAYDDVHNAFSSFALSGIDEQHYGLEFGFKVPTFVPNLSLQGVAAWGRYEYISNPLMVQVVDNDASPVSFDGMTSVRVSYWKNHPVFARNEDGSYRRGEDGKWVIDRYQQHYVPSTPQLALSGGLAWNYDYWFVDADLEYFADAYLDMSPIYRNDLATAGPDRTVTPAEIEYMAAQERFDPCWLLNFSIGKSWYIRRSSQVGFSLNVKNLLNNRSVKTGGFEQYRIVENTVGKERYYRFDSKYFYMSGTNYMLNLYFRF